MLNKPRAEAFEEGDGAGSWQLNENVMEKY